VSVPPETNLKFLFFKDSPKAFVFFITSGIRLGTAAVTTRGLKEEEMEKISFWIDEALSHIKEENVLARIKEEVKKMCHHFPLYRSDKS